MGILSGMTHEKIHREFGYYVLLFFITAFIGWLWEVGLFWFTNHAFVNRGVYRGPYLPIYGAGGILLCFLLRRLGKKPLWVFLLSALVCSGLEYFTGWFLEYLWGIRWWDYSGHALNLNGRICLVGTVVFGLGGTALICPLLPLYEKLYRTLSQKWRLCLCLFLLLVFIADATYCAVRPNTGPGISSGTSSAFHCLDGRMRARGPTISSRMRNSSCCLCSRWETRSENPAAPHSFP